MLRDSDYSQGMRFKWLFIAIGLLCMARSAHADMQEIILTGSNGYVSVGQTFALEIGLGYHVPVGSGVQFGMGTSFRWLTNEYLGTFALGPTVNFGGATMHQQFFLSASAGIIVGSVLSTAKLQLGVAAGKRFQLIRDLIYRPSVGATMVDGVITIVGNFIGLSFLF